MGSRLGVFVKTRDGWVNRYDHSAAQNLGSALALGGVDVTMPLIWSMSPLGPEVPAAWTLAPWFEGALLVDLTTRTLAWSEETDCEYMPRLVNDLMERTWPGWTAVWAPEGPRGVLAAAGVDADPMYAGVDINLRPFDDSPWLLPWNQPHGDDPLSVRLPTGELVCWGASPVFDFIGELPPEAVRSVASEMLERSKSGSSNLWHDNPPDERPSSGTHVDFRKRLVRWWSMRAEDWAISAYSRYWPGWSVETMGDDHEWHGAILGSDLHDWQQDVGEFRYWLGRRSADPSWLFKVESEVPGGLVAVERNKVLVLERLRELEESVPLPPARFINRKGLIR